MSEVQPVTVDEAWELLAEAERQVEENLKEDEALFTDMGSYALKKKDVIEFRAVIWTPADRKSDKIMIMASDDGIYFDEEDLDMLRSDYGYELPTGLYLLKFWGHEYDVMTDCGVEYDFTYSKNYEVRKLSDLCLYDYLTQRL